MEIYALCENGREEAYITFLRKLKRENNWPVTAVLDTCSDGTIDSLVRENLCETICSARTETNKTNSVSVYPSISRTTLYQMSVGMDTVPLPGWMKKDFDYGRPSIILTRGLDPFTGLEPKAYQDKILGYIRELVSMGVRFVGDTTSESTQASRMESKIYIPEISGNLLLAKSLRQIPEGGRLKLPEDTVITPLAREYMRDHNIQFG